MRASDSVPLALNAAPITNPPGMVSRMVRVRGEPGAFADFRQQFFRFVLPQVVEISDRNLCPGGRIGGALAEILDRPVVADAFDRFGELRVARDQAIEILLGNREQLRVGESSHRRCSRAAA